MKRRNFVLAKLCLGGWLLYAAYAAGYFATFRTQSEYWGNPDASGGWRFRYYSPHGGEVVENLYMPMLWIDTQIRPGYWKHYRKANEPLDI